MSSRRDTENLAEKYAKKGRFDEAIREYKKLLMNGEDDIPVRNIIGDLYVKAGQEEKAVHEFRQIARQYEEKKIFAKSIALYKRITRLAPHDHASAEKLAELLSFQGYISEAKDEYRQLAQKYAAIDENQNAARMYRLLINLDHADEGSRHALVEIYEKEGLVEQAVEQLNVLAEKKVLEEKFQQARELLGRARNMDIDHTRTLFNLIGLLTRDKKENEALSLVRNILEKDEQNIKALRIYGNLLLQKNEFKKAEKIFSKILEINPGEINAIIKLGMIDIQQNDFDEAFALFEPLVDNFLKRNEADKAISLLGLILKTKVVYLPALEKTARIYEVKNQPEKLMIVYRIILNQYRKAGDKEGALDTLRKLVRAFPDEDNYYREFKKLKKEMGHNEKEEESVESIIQQKDAELTLEERLNQADLYITQGLIRIAKRFLENLKIDYPEEPVIAKKLEEIKDILTDTRQDGISDKMEKITQKPAESKTAEKEKAAEEEEAEKKDTQEEAPEEKVSADEKKGDVVAEEKEKEEKTVEEEVIEEPAPGEDVALEEDVTPERDIIPEEDLVSAAHIFADTDIIPFVSPEDEAVDFFDLAERVDEELDAIEYVMSIQKERISSTSEKPLKEIIKEFKRGLSERIQEASDESRYDLGVAFMEQGLWDEAIEEFKWASRASELTVDSFLSIGICLQGKKDYGEAVKWIHKALDLAEKDSTLFFSLKYELASIFEDMGDNLKAIQTFIEVKEWKSDFRDVGQKLREVALKIK